MIGYCDGRPIPDASLIGNQSPDWGALSRVDGPLNSSVSRMRATWHPCDYENRKLKVHCPLRTIIKAAKLGSLARTWQPCVAVLRTSMTELTRSTGRDV